MYTMKVLITSLPWFLMLCFYLTFESVAASNYNFFDEKMRALEGRKKSIYLDGGVVYSIKENDQRNHLASVRYHYKKSDLEERIVLDFLGNTLPEIYMYIDKKENKVFIDVFNCALHESGIRSLGLSQYIENVHFFSISENLLSVELIFKKKFTFDVFYLESPARLVLDVK